MNNTLDKKKPGGVVRAYTQQVRDHTGAMERLRDQYFSALKRAEAHYFDGVKRIHDALAADAESEGIVRDEAIYAEAPQEQQAAAS